jgi:MFS family permease
VDDVRQPWYHGITRYQWAVLLIASLGWIFDVFEGQIFVASMTEAMPSLASSSPINADDLNRIALAGFLLGGALGGVLFGQLSDRIGRTRTMILTIATYSLFTFVSALSQTWWHLVLCRFLVALGVGGEWAVASALVAEVFPSRARARSLALFHASSVFGTLLAVAAGYFIVANPSLHLALPGGAELRGWRLGFVVGGVPALLIIWIRLSLREPEGWRNVHAATQAGVARAGNLRELFGPEFATRTIVGVGLAAVGLATFWGVHVYGKNLLRQSKEDDHLTQVIGDVPAADWPMSLRQVIDEFRSANVSEAERVQRFQQWIFDPAHAREKRELFKPWDETIKKWEMIGMLLVTLGGGAGLVTFGPLAEWLGRRGAFLLFQIGGLISAFILFQFIFGQTALLIALPIFGFLTLGMHAGFAVYFPELYPTRLRGTGTGFCFNAGRILAAPLLFMGGANVSIEKSASIISLLFLLGPLLLLAAPETRGRELT